MLVKKNNTYKKNVNYFLDYVAKSYNFSFMMFFAQMICESDYHGADREFIFTSCVF